MPRLQQIPEQLKRGPFTVAQAERLGFGRQRLRGPNWRRLGTGIYVWGDCETDALAELRAIQCRLPAGCVFSGRTAAQLHGMDEDGTAVVDVTTPPGVVLRPRPGVCVHSAALDPADVTIRAHLRTTTPLRTCFDLARSLPLVEAVTILDGAIARRVVALSGLREYVARMERVRGVPAARRVVELVVSNVESPMGSRLRLILVLGGLPRPAVQVELPDPGGRLLGRPDLLYRAERLAIEYDGATHRDSLVADHRRQNLLQGAATFCSATAPPTSITNRT
jgi:hypothetical protein